MSEPPRQPIRRGSAAGCASLLALFSVLAVIGLPQKASLEWALESGLGARVDAEDVRLAGGSAEVGELTIRSQDADKPPVAVLRDVLLRYRVKPREGRYVPELRIGGLELAAAAEDPSQTNFGFLVDMMAKPPSGRDPSPYLPEVVHVERIAFTGAYASWRGSFDGLSLKARLLGPDDADLALRGARIPLRIEQGGQAVEVRGRTVVEASLRSGRLTQAEILLDLPRVLTARAVVHGGAQELRVTVHSFRLHGAALEELGLIDPESVVFNTLAAADTRIAVTLGGRGLPLLGGTKLRLEAQGLRLGPDEAPYYDGRAALTADISESGGENHAVFALGLNEGQVIQGAAAGDLAQGTANVAIADWSRGNILDAAPSVSRALLEEVPQLAGVSAEATASWDDEAVAAEVDLEPVLRQDDAERTLPFVLRGRMRRGKGEGALAEATLTGQWAGGSLSAFVEADSAEAFRSEVNCEALRPDLLWRAVFREAAPFDAPEARLAGAATLRSDERGYASGAFRLTGLGPQGDGRLTLEGEGQAGSLLANDWAGTVALTSDTGRGPGRVEADLDMSRKRMLKLGLRELDALGLAHALNPEWAGPSDRGLLNGEASLSKVDGSYAVSAHIDAGPVQYGGVTVGAEHPLDLSVHASFRLDKNRELPIGQASLRAGGLGADRQGVLALTAEAPSGEHRLVAGLTLPKTNPDAQVHVNTEWGAPVQSEISVTGFDPFDVVRLVAPERPEAEWRAPLAGAAFVSLGETSADIRVESAVKGLELGEAVSLPETEVTLQAQGALQPKGARDVTVKLEVGNMASAAVSDAQFDWSPWRGGASFDLSASFDELAPALGLGPLYGSATAGGAVRLDGARLRLTDLEVVTDYLSYGPIPAVSMEPVTVAGDAEVDLDTLTLQSPRLQVTTPGTHLSLESVSAGWEPLYVEAEAFSLDTDLRPLVDMAYLQSARAHATASGAVTYRDGALSGRVDASAEAEELILMDALAAFMGASLQLQAEGAGGAWSGEGALRAESAVAAGLLFSGVADDVTVDENTVILKGLRAGALSGEVTLTARLAPFEEGLPLSAEAEVNGVDLAEFTKQFGLEDAKMTGIASGNASISMKGGEIQGFDAFLESTEDFSMNSDYVAHLLVARHFGDAGPTKRVKDIVADVVGEGPRRPFDSAMLDVGMDESGDDITGMAELKSELLNMTIELNVDPRHIAQVLKLHQQVGLDRIEGVSMPGPGEDQDEAGDDDAGSAGEGSNGGVE